MIFAWLGKQLFGLPRGLWLLVGLCGLMIALMGLWASTGRENRELGARVERAARMAETIDRVEQAQETRDAIEDEIDAGGGSVLYDQCLRSARTPANCQRFLPGRQAGQR